MELSYDIRIDALDKNLTNQKIVYTDQVKVERPLVVGDGAITIDFSALTTVKALYIKCSGPITATLNGVAVLVQNLLFADLTSLTSLTVQTAETTDIDIEVAVFGV